MREQVKERGEKRRRWVDASDSFCGQLRRAQNKADTTAVRGWETEEKMQEYHDKEREERGKERERRREKIGE